MTLEQIADCIQRQKPYFDEADGTRVWLNPSLFPAKREPVRHNLARKPQNFDTSELPLFGDSAKQTEMF